MISTLEKKKYINEPVKKSVNGKIKKIVKDYIELGLIDGYLDADGKTILSKEAFDDWD